MEILKIAGNLIRSVITLCFRYGSGGFSIFLFRCRANVVGLTNMDITGHSINSIAILNSIIVVTDQPSLFGLTEYDFAILELMNEDRTQIG